VNYFRRNSLTGAPFPLKLHRKGRLGPTQLPLKWQLLKPRRRRDLGSPAAVNSHFWFRVTFAHLFWTGFDRETFTPYPKSSQKHFQSIFPPFRGHLVCILYTRRLVVLFFGRRPVSDFLQFFSTSFREHLEAV
jgi:hypothetical protein